MIYTFYYIVIIPHNRDDTPQDYVCQFRAHNGNEIIITGIRSVHGPGVDSASNRNEYQEHFLGVKVADV